MHTHTHTHQTLTCCTEWASDRVEAHRIYLIYVRVCQLQWERPTARTNMKCLNCALLLVFPSLIFDPYNYQFSKKPNEKKSRTFMHRIVCMRAPKWNVEEFLPFWEYFDVLCVCVRVHCACIKMHRKQHKIIVQRMMDTNWHNYSQTVISSNSYSLAGMNVEKWDSILRLGTHTSSPDNPKPASTFTIHETVQHCCVTSYLQIGMSVSFDTLDFSNEFRGIFHFIFEFDLVKPNLVICDTV